MNVTLEALRERYIDRNARFLLEKGSTSHWDDSNNFNGLVRFFFAQVGAHSHSTAATAFRAWRIAGGKLDPLPERVAVRPKFLRQRFVNNRDGRALSLRRLRSGKSATAQDRKPDRLEIIRADSIPARIECETLGGCRWFVVLARTECRPAASLAQRNHAKRNCRADARVFHARQRGEPCTQIPIKLLRAFLFVTGEARVDFEQIARTRFQSGIDQAALFAPRMKNAAAVRNASENAI